MIVIKINNLGLARELKPMELVGDGDTSCGYYTWNNSQRTDKGDGALGNKRTSREHPIYRIIMIDLNTEKSPGDLRGLAVSHTLVRNMS